MGDGGDNEETAQRTKNATFCKRLTREVRESRFLFLDGVRKMMPVIPIITIIADHHVAEKWITKGTPHIPEPLGAIT